MPDDYSVFKLGDQSVRMDTSYEIEKHAPQSGTVISVPDELDYEVSGLPEIDFDTVLEIKPGDRIIFDYNAVKSAIEDGFFYDKVAAIKYSDIYMVTRGEEGFAINGYTVVLPKEDQYTGVIHCPVSANGRSLSVGRVIFSSTPLKGYKLFPEHGPDNEVTVPGETILFHKVDAIRLQYEQHAAQRRILYRMQHRDICARIIDGVVSPLNHYVVIKQDEQRLGRGGIIRGTRDLRKPPTGTIVRYGAGYKDRPLDLPVGTWCQFDELFATSFIENGIEYLILPEFNIPCYQIAA